MLFPVITIRMIKHVMLFNTIFEAEEWNAMCHNSIYKISLFAWAQIRFACKGCLRFSVQHYFLCHFYHIMFLLYRCIDCCLVHCLYYLFRSGNETYSDTTSEIEQTTRWNSRRKNDLEILEIRPVFELKQLTLRIHHKHVISMDDSETLGK